MSDRYARQRLIEWWDQARLQQARVLVAGIGALGNELVKNLALLGVGHLLLIDADRVEASNLSRTVLFTESDLGRPKVVAAADAVARLNPQVEVRTIDGDLRYDVGLGWYRRADLAVGCLDNLTARSQVGLCCTLAGRPFLDGGMWALGGEARWFAAGAGACFDCTLGAEDRARATVRQSCIFQPVDAEHTRPVATVATTAAIIGGLLAQEVVKFLCRQPVTMSQAIVYNGQALSLHRAALERSNGCTSTHEPYDGVIEIPASPGELTACDLMGRAREDVRALTPDGAPDQRVLDLGRNLVLEFHCANCGRREDVNRIVERLSEGARACPHCGAAREVALLSAVEEHSSHTSRTLTDWGIPTGEVLAVRGRGGLSLYQLSKGLW